MDVEMADLFNTVSARDGKWKYELDVAAYKLGNPYQPEDEMDEGHEISKSTRGGGVPPDGMDGMVFGEDANQMGNGMDGLEDPFMDFSRGEVSL